MKPILLLSLLCLAACEPWGMSYTPKLSAPAKDGAKFSADLDFCRNDMVRRFKIAEKNHENDVAPRMGLLGYMYATSSADPNDDFYKSQEQVIDECMTQKGYDVIKQNHCC